MNSIKNKKIFAGALFAMVFSFGVFGLAKADNTLTINKSGSGYGKVIIKNSTGGELQTCDFTGSATSCEYSQSGTNGVFIYIKPNSGSSFGGKDGCTSSNLSVDNFNETQHCSVDLNSNKTLSVTINSGSSSSNSSSSSSTGSSSNSSSSSSSAKANQTVTTEAATSVTSTTATLNGSINSKSENVAYLFYYRKKGDSKYNYNTGWIGTVNDSSSVSVSKDITGLSPNTTYYYVISTYSYSTKASKTGTEKYFTTSSSDGSSSSSSSEKTYKLKVKVSGAGKIKGFYDNETVINCHKNKEGKHESDKCEANIPAKKSVNLEIYESSGSYKFATWADACRGRGKQSTCTVTMSGNKTVSGTFNYKREGGIDVSVRKTGDGSGKVVSIHYSGKDSGKEDGKINCGANCSETYEQNCRSEAEGDRSCGYAYFKAVSEKGSSFGGWGGDCKTFSGKKDQCYVILDGGKSINANFKVSDSKSSKSSKSKSSSSSLSSSSSSSSVSAIKSTTKSATNITSTSATLNGMIEPNGNTAYYTFSYRKESDASSKTKYAPSSSTYSSVNGTSGEISVSADISGLSSGTKYLYRLYSYSGTTGKNGNGALGSFTTSGGSSSSSSSSN